MTEVTKSELMKSHLEEILRDNGRLLEAFAIKDALREKIVSCRALDVDTFEAMNALSSMLVVVSTEKHRHMKGIIQRLVEP